MNSQAAVDMVKEHMAKFIPDNLIENMSKEDIIGHLARIGDILANHASKTLGSADNVTVQILLFRRTLSEVARRNSLTANDSFRIPFHGRSFTGNAPRSKHQDNNNKDEDEDELYFSSATPTQSSLRRGGEEKRSTGRYDGIGLSASHSSQFSAGKTETEREGEGDDELMDFLMDDTNF
mmetsp:Transcript_7342/g.7557  ORF Transcript_7342/g.7557 Transcript_7342/m.7557 type:complete len:179 (+) Transcript_7342:41-577(+)